MRTTWSRSTVTSRPHLASQIRQNVKMVSATPAPTATTELGCNALGLAVDPDQMVGAAEECGRHNRQSDTDGRVLSSTSVIDGAALAGHVTIGELRECPVHDRGPDRVSGAPGKVR
jgi:hypothetical protein